MLHQDAAQDGQIWDDGVDKDGSDLGLQDTSHEQPTWHHEPTFSSLYYRITEANRKRAEVAMPEVAMPIEARR
jgi:hypothetical protein